MSQKFFEAVIQGPNNIESANHIIKTTTWVSIFVIAITAAFAIFGFFQASTDETLNYLLDPWLLVDVVLMSIFTFYLYKRKLWAPIALAVHQLFGIVIMYIDLEKFPGVIVIFKLLLFVGAARSIYFINNYQVTAEVENA
ncbi:hypothetical protein ACROAE_02690 [Shewanella sp. MF05960]|uniref:hypothetical protein n=1 Tax=Shewanella sp. MF05960 TaxID=3434874 RepID=UPI003D7B70B4